MVADKKCHISGIAPYCGAVQRLKQRMVEHTHTPVFVELFSSHRSSVFLSGQILGQSVVRSGSAQLRGNKPKHSFKVFHFPTSSEPLSQVTGEHQADRSRDQRWGLSL